MKRGVSLLCLVPVLILGQTVSSGQEKPTGLTTPKMGQTLVTLPSALEEELNLAHLAPPDYPLGAGDALRITFYGEINARFNLTVDHLDKLFVPAHTLQTLGPMKTEERVIVPALGEIHAGGLTVSELQDTLDSLLEEMFRNVRANVTITELRTVRLHVLGNVAVPGSHYLPGIARVSDCLAKSGSVQYPGSPRTVHLERATGETLTLDLYQYLAHGDLSENPYVLSEDRIVVPPATKLIVVEGAVEKPGIYELKPGEMLSDLISMADGVTPYCDVHRVRITNLQDPGRDRTVDIYDLIYEGSDALDIDLRHGDKVSLPTLPYTVTVVGEVGQGGTFPFEPGNDFYYYLGQAGGSTEYSSLGSTTIQRYDGKRLRYRTGVEIQPGDVFFVPRRQISGLKDILQIISQAATVFFIIWQVSGTSE
jgi:protein involved in polysaccharide export with SLBB domain